MNQLPSTLSEKDRPAIDSLSSDPTLAGLPGYHQKEYWAFEQAGYNLEVEGLPFYYFIGQSRKPMLQINKGIQWRWWNSRLPHA